MKQLNFTKQILIMLVAMTISTWSCAQMDKSKRPSPPATAKGMAGGANITIDYSSPSVVSPKGVDRTGKIWGDLEPYDKFWRAGANEATTITTDKDVMVEGKKLPKGKYTFFVKPAEDGNWTIVINSETGQWGIKRGGDANFDPANNVVEATVKTEKLSSLVKRLKYDINSNGFDLEWEHVKVPVSITAAM